jgi:biopolymer transport protein ExbB
MPMQEEGTSLWSFMLKGGPMMVPIVALSIVALAIVLAKMWDLWRFRVGLDRLTRKTNHLIRNGELSVALHACQEEDSPLGRLYAGAILFRSLDRAEINRRLERLGTDVVASLEAYLSSLAAITGVEPMLGFLGTIIGLIQAFMSWEALGERITINLLAGGIYQAMITTAAGLSVAIPYYLVYIYLVARVKRLTRAVENRTEALVDLVAAAGAEGDGKEPLQHAL